MSPHAATRNRVILFALWIVFYASFTLFLPPLLDDADSVHAEVAREMVQRHDWITLYANGIRYLEKAPVLYWSMAASFRLFGVSTAAARLPIALTVLALALLLEAFARQAFASPEQETTGTRAGLYAGLIFLSGFGIFIFTRITIPDADVCLWLTLALFAFWTTEQPDLAFASNQPDFPKRGWTATSSAVSRRPCYLFAAACALNVLTKGLIGIVFPVAIVLAYLLLTRGPAAAWRRLRQFHPAASLLVFLALAAPWHLLIGLANPTQGHPAPITFTNHHWLVPTPTDGNVHGWFWFYFVNEHLLRYLNLRVPRDYDTVPLALFLGLILIWLMPWSAFLYQALTRIPLLPAIAERPLLSRVLPSRLRARLQPCHPRNAESAALAAEVRLSPAPPPTHETPHSMADATRQAHEPGTPSLPTASSSIRVRSSPNLALSHAGNTRLLLAFWAATPLLFFSLSTRQEYYVLPALPALILLISDWMAEDSKITVVLRQAPDTREDGPGLSEVTQKRLWLTDPDPASIRGPFLVKVEGSATRIALVLFLLGSAASAATLVFLLHTAKPAPDTDLATLLQQNPGDYALSMGHFLDLNAHALGLFRLPLALTAATLFLGTLAHWQLRRRNLPHAANLTLAAATFVFLFAAHLGLQTFAPVLSSKPLADAMAPQLHPEDLIVLHGEYESGSTLGFYLHRNDLHILEGRSSNLWYGSFFPDAPKIFETRESLAAKWPGPQRIFLWQDPSDRDRPILQLPGQTFRIARSGGKEILSNQPNHEVPAPVTLVREARKGPYHAL